MNHQQIREEARMRMTEREIREATAKARMSEAEKEVLLQRALAGEPEARFAVFALARRQG